MVEPQSDRDYRRTGILKRLPSPKEYTVDEEEISIYKKMMVGEAVTPGTIEAIREEFFRKGIFSVKVTLLGANKVLLEEIEAGAIQELMKEEK